MPHRDDSLAALPRQKAGAAILGSLCGPRAKRIVPEMTCAEAQELITALIDQELGQAERSSLEEHLSQCSGCRLAFEDESALKQKIREAAQRINAPGQLRDRILSDPRIFPQRDRSTRPWYDYLRPKPTLLRPILAFALLLAIALPMFYFSKPRGEPIGLAAVETYDLFLRGDLPVRTTENTDQIVEELTRAVGGDFHPMGYNLTAMNLRPVAGLVREIASSAILFSAPRKMRRRMPPGFLTPPKRWTFMRFPAGGSTRCFTVKAE